MSPSVRSTPLPPLLQLCIPAAASDKMPLEGSREIPPLPPPPSPGSHVVCFVEKHRVQTEGALLVMWAH